MADKKKKWDYTFEIRKRIKPGSYLLSEPYMQDNYFKRSVCFICDHNKRDGTFGFIINKPTKKMLHFFVDDIEKNEFEVFYGGPVANDSLYYIHNNELQLEGAKQVTDNLYWGGNFEQVKIALQNKTLQPDSIRFFLGYSGWDNGQLRKEIIENSWIVSEERNDELVFSDYHYLWQNMMKEMGDMYEEMAKFPEHPSLN